MTEHDQEFRRLFWAARLEHGAIRSGQDGTSCRSHINACSLGLSLGWEWIPSLLDASIKALAGHLSEASVALAQAGPAVSVQHKCLVTFLEASLAYLRREHELALELSLPLLLDETFDRKGYVYCNRGESFVALHRFDEAMQSYRDALNEEDYDYPAYALNNLGRILLYEVHDLDGAIETFEKALDSEPAHVHSATYFYLGIAHQRCGDLKQALECFHKSLDCPGPSELYQLSSIREIYAIRQQSRGLSADEASLVKWWTRDRTKPEDEMSPEGRVSVKILKARETQYDKNLRQNRRDLVSMARKLHSLSF